MGALASALLFGVLACSPVRASTEERELADAYANGLRAFEQGDRAAALGFWAPLSEQGDPRAQFGLGLIYEAGLGGTADEEAALAWYQRAARLGFSPAQNNLALMYAEGRVVSRDLAQAARLWRQAATAGFGRAQHNLALALANGSGVERDEREAAEWQHRANAQRLLAAKLGRQGPAREDPAVEGEGPQRERDPVAIVRSAARSLPPTLSAPDAPAPADAFWVQLASLRRHEDGVHLGQELARLHADLLALWQPTVRTVDLGGKGVWHRVLFGPIPGGEQAALLCAQMRARVGACLVGKGPRTTRRSPRRPLPPPAHDRSRAPWAR